MGQVIQFPQRQRGHADLGGLIGIILTVFGVICTGGGLFLLWIGVRMVLA